MWRSKAVRSALALALFASVGCAGAEASRVRVEKDRTDIAFGFTQTPAPTARGTGPRQPQATDALDGGSARPTPLPDFGFSQPPPAECPQASGDAPVTEPAPPDAVSYPRPGEYAWKTKGSYLVGGGSARLPLPTSVAHYVGPHERYDDPVSESDQNNFTYYTVEPRIGASTTGFWLFHWQVKRRPTSGDPEGGLVLKRIDVLDQGGNVVDTYFDDLSNGVLFSPFPFTPGDNWTSTSIDLSRGRTLQLSGSSKSRKIVDACGTVIEGWEVTATFTDGGASADLSYLVATQYAGQLISLTIDGTFLGTEFAKATFHVGRLEPKPLPDRFTR